MKTLFPLFVTLLPALAAGAGVDARIEAAMAKADADGSGTVGLAEAKRFGITLDSFRKANPAHDGSLDRKEFAAAIAVQYETSGAGGNGGLDWPQASRAGVRSKQVFDAADPDRDGKLDFAEYLAAMVAQTR